jgi:arsenate reductase
MSDVRRVLFVCTHNSARSQMAEGFLNALGGDRFEAASAGTEARGVHPFAIQAMAEDGIDISTRESKTIDRYLDEAFDLVITVCDDAAEACPVFPNARERRHWSFPDPSLARGTDDERFARFAEVRDAIRERITRELLAGRPLAQDEALA